jgi:hypothetical protein
MSEARKSRYQGVIDARAADLSEAERVESDARVRAARGDTPEEIDELMRSNESLTGAHGTPPATASGRPGIDFDLEDL